MVYKKYLKEVAERAIDFQKDMIKETPPNYEDVVNFIVYRL